MTKRVTLPKIAGKVIHVAAIEIEDVQGADLVSEEVIETEGAIVAIEGPAVTDPDLETAVTTEAAAGEGQSHRGLVQQAQSQNHQGHEADQIQISQ